MNTPTPQETLARLKKSGRRGALFGWGMGILAVVVGLGILVDGSFWFGSARTEGTVVRHEPGVVVVSAPDPGGTGYVPPPQAFVVYYPVVEYQVDGRTYSYLSKFDYEYRAVGQKVPLVYKVDRPEVSRIDSYSDRWARALWMSVPLVVMGLFVLAGTAVWRRILRRLEATIDAQANAPAV